MSELTHFDERGNAHMVDVGDKDTTHRVALARGEIRMQTETLKLIVEGRAKKGDVLGVARIAAIMAAKKTHEIIPLCHPLMLTSINVDFEPDESRNLVRIEARVETRGKTGVEMEALTAVSAAALTIYDMVKAVERGMHIEGIHLVEKRGGKSGRYRAGA